jgi:chromosome partitioning protein
MILSITNLKGGVGKSTIAQNIAVCLRQKGHSVFLVDTDFELKTTTDWGNDRSTDLVKIDVECVQI